MANYGLYFPLIFENGSYIEPDLESSIDSSLRIIFIWVLRTRYFTPSFGSIIPVFLGSGLSETSLDLLKIYTLQAIQSWEKRIQVTSLSLYPNWEIGSVTLELSAIIVKEQRTYNYTVTL